MRILFDLDVLTRKLDRLMEQEVTLPGHLLSQDINSNDGPDSRPRPTCRSLYEKPEGAGIYTGLC